MVDPARYAHPFQRMIDDPVSTLAELRADACRFEAEAMADENATVVANAVIPTLDSLGFMAFRRCGTRIEIPNHEWLPELDNFEALLARKSVDHDHRHSLVVERGDGRPQHLFWHDWDEARQWNLPRGVRDVCEAGSATILVLVAGGAAGDGPIAQATRSFGLSGLEARVAMAVVRTGSARAAAPATNLSYATVREVLSSAAQRMNQPNTAALVRTLVLATFGILPLEDNSGSLLAEMFPLTLRQAQLALLISEGLTREVAAGAIGISAAVAKKELAAIYANLGVGSAAELARFIAEAQALRAFARTTEGIPGFQDFEIEPVRRTARKGSRDYIGWSDHGPASGQPVLVVHSNWQCRSVPRPLVAALQAQGWRPIAIDRPGFGSTPLGSSSIDDPFGQAITDTLQILDQLKLDKVAVIARCGAQFVHALKSSSPERVGPVQLVSPTPQTDEASLRRGLVGTVKEAFYKSPKMVEFFMRIASAQHSLTRIEALTRALVKGCPSDEALCNDPQFIRDRFRAIRPFSTGNLSGAVIEEHSISHNRSPPTPIATTDWAIVQGAQEVHNSFDDVARYWGPILPQCPIVSISDGGRFMTSSHPAQLVALLDKLAVGEQPSHAVPA